MATDHLHNPLHEHMRVEHEELRESIGSLLHTIRTRSVKAKEIKPLIAQLCQRLKTHFEEEEAGGFFADITQQAPRLSREVDTLCEEHTKLLDEAVELAEKSGHCQDTDAWWNTIEQEYEQLRKQLLHHESDENLLLQQAYNEDIGTQD